MQSINGVYWAARCAQAEQQQADVTALQAENAELKKQLDELQELGAIEAGGNPSGDTKPKSFDEMSEKEQEAALLKDLNSLD